MRLLTMAVLAFELGAVGCLGLGSGTPPTRSYVLTSAPKKGASAAPREKPLVIGVGPVNVPRFIDRPQIVTLSSGNEVQFAEFDRWAEPISDGIARTLVEDLAALLPGGSVEGYPWPLEAAPEVEVRVDVQRFAGTLGGSAVIEARWLLRRDKRDAVSRLSRHEAIPRVGTYGALVAAWSGLIAEVAADIASELARAP